MKPILDFTYQAIQTKTHVNDRWLLTQTVIIHHILCIRIPLLLSQQHQFRERNYWWYNVHKAIQEKKNNSIAHPNICNIQFTNCKHCKYYMLKIPSNWNCFRSEYRYFIHLLDPANRMISFHIGAQKWIKILRQLSIAMFYFDSETNLMIIYTIRHWIDSFEFPDLKNAHDCWNRTCGAAQAIIANNHPKVKMNWKMTNKHGIHRESIRFPLAKKLLIAYPRYSISHIEWMYGMYCNGKMIAGSQPQFY